ncbi:hypothetical protein Tco_0717692 [Tanacetum coccineum]
MSICSLCIRNLEPLRLDVLALKASDVSLFGENVVKKKVTLSANDNIISDDPTDALKLAKSISQTEAEEVEAARKVHATHARIVTESVSESSKKKSSDRSSKSVVIQDTPSAPKSKPTMSHPAKAETRGVTSWISSQHNGVNNRESLHA